MNFSDPMLKLKRALRRANDCCLKGEYEEAHAELDAIREYALAAQTQMRLADRRCKELEMSSR